MKTFFVTILKSRGRKGGRGGGEGRVREILKGVPETCPKNRENYGTWGKMEIIQD